MRPIADPFYDRDAPGVKRCDTCDQVIEGKVYPIGEWKFCKRCHAEETREISVNVSAAKPIELPQ